VQGNHSNKMRVIFGLMGNLKRIFICIALLGGVLSSGVFAATDSGKYAIRGAGLIDCQTYLTEQEKQSPAYMMIGGWIDGYITGINQYATNTFDATSFESTELFAEIIKNHCQKNPEDRLLPVMNSIISQQWKKRITDFSPLVNVTLGDSSVRIYRETIVRLQERLAEKGFFKLPATGQFDSNTIEGIASFQRTLKGYKVTGFPDQATLVSLFAE